MNFLKVIALFIAGSAREIANEGKEALRLTRNLLITAIAVPFLLLVIGVSLGALGQTVDSVGTIGVGQSFIVVGAFLASALLGFVLIRTTVLGYVLVAGSKVARAAFDAFPGLETTEVKEAGRKLAGVMAFVTGACLYAQVVPIWRAVGISLIALTSMVGLAYIMAAGWYGGKWARAALTAFVLLSLTFSTARIVSPNFARFLATFNERHLGPDRMNDTDSRLLRRFAEERDAIRRRAVDDCAGRYCNEADARRIQDLEQNIARLQNGTYWDNVSNAMTAAPAAPQAVQPSPSLGGSASSASLPPPPAVPRREPATSTVDAHAGHPAAHARRPRGSDTFQELDQFPDISATQPVPSTPF
ncbi:MAG TPA: hypothetical protein VL426_04290 [Candidatus Binatia bacterium]|jgi:hypothetical protein|nr:hypothetical protein [Candidatus Binatia bacterium]